MPISSQAGADDAEGAGGDPGERRAGLGPGRAVRDLRADRVEVAEAGQRPRPEPHAAQAADDADTSPGGCHRTLLLPLDDLLALIREFLNPDVSRSGLDRCLCRHGMSKRQDLKPKAAKPAHKPFKAYEPGYLHIDVKYLPQMADEEKRRSLFVAIDRATRWVFVRIYPVKTAANARRFLRDLHRAVPIRAAPMKSTRVLMDNGKEHRPALRPPPPSGHREPRVRPPLRGAWHRAPPRSADAARNERHGGAVQRPDRGRPAEPLLPLRRGS